jgi:regulator of RNase E activity RraA
MFIRNDPPAPIDAAALALLGRAEPATIGHFRHTGFIDPGVHGLIPGHRIAGTAVTVHCFGPDTTMVHYALGKLRPGDVLLIDRAGDTRHAACGGGGAVAPGDAVLADENGVLVLKPHEITAAGRAVSFGSPFGIIAHLFSDRLA